MQHTKAKILRYAAEIIAIVFFQFLANNPIAFAIDPGRTIKQYNHIVWRYDEGLPQNSVRALVNTRDGYLWIGTNGGLIRFDGMQFTIFDKTTSQGILGNSISSLLETRDGSLWIGTDNGLTRMKDMRFITLTKADGLSSNSITGLCEDSSGSLWITTADSGLNMIKAGIVTHYSKRDGLLSEHLSCVTLGVNQSILIGSTSGFSRYENGKFTSITTRDGLSNKMVRAIIQEADSSMWIGTDLGLNFYKNGRWTNFTKRDGLANNQIRSLYKDRDGNLWVGTNDGLSRISKKHIYSFSVNDGLSGGRVYAMCEDYEGNFWTGTLSGGIDKFSTGKFTIYTKQDGLGHNEIRPIYQAQDGTIWIGTNGGGLTQYNDGLWKTITKRNGLPHNGIRAICEDQANSLWVGTSGGGLCRIANHKITKWTTKDGLSNNYIFSMLMSRDQTLWVGTRKGGISTFKNGKFTTINTDNGLPNNTVRVIIETRDSTLWAGTDSGLTHFDHDRIRNYTTKDGLSNNIIYSIYEDTDGTLWIGTFRGGMNRLKNGRFSSITKRDGLYDNSVFQILNDNQNNLWMTCNTGIYRVCLKELNDFADGRISSIHSTVFGRTEGMKSTKCDGSCEPAGIRADDGKLWIPTLNGVVVIDPKKTEKHAPPPPVVIEKIFFDHKELAFDTPLVIGPGNGDFEFQYTAPSFNSPKNVNFKYMLVGFDEDWTNAQTRRVAYYTNIRPGSYSFKLRACNNEGTWNETEAEIRFTLAAHFYQTYWFAGIVAVTVFFAGAGVVRIRTRTVRKREQTLINIVDERTKDLQQEITERKRSEIALKESEERYRFLFEHNPAPMLIYERTSLHIIAVNEAFLDHYGYAKDEIISTYFPNMYPKIEKEKITRLIPQLHGHANVGEWHHYKKNGSLITVVLYSHDLIFESVIARVVVITDITERKNAEQKLQESEERYRRLVDFSPDAIAVHSSGIFCYVNPTALKLLGAEHESQLIGKPASAFIHPDDNELAAPQSGQHTESGAPFQSMEEKFIRLDGNVVDVQLTSIPIIFEGKPATLVVARDITEQKRLQEQVLQSQKIQSIGTLAGGIAHDFNNILGIILGYTSLIEQDKSDPKKLDESLIAITQATERGAGLVRQILTFARKTDVAFQPLSVPVIIHELLLMVKQTFPKTVTFSEHYAYNLPDVLADRTQIHQAILNICLNARDAMPNGGVISITVVERSNESVRTLFPEATFEHYVCIEIADSGEGMNEKTRLRIFDPFFTTKEKDKGTGLGLSVVYGIMQSHQGFIDVVSQVAGGTTFALYLPVHKSEQMDYEDNEHSKTTLPGGTETILVVEDESSLLNLVRLTLSSKGYYVIAAVDGIEAIEMYRTYRNEIDLVISDIGLPKLDGVNVFKQLKEINPNVRVILSSGYFDPETRVELDRAGVKGFVQKPYLPEEILIKIREMLDEM